MKHIRSAIAALLLFALFLTTWPAALSAQPQPREMMAATDALREGRILLKRGQADQALAKLLTALKLYQQVKRPKGEAAANDALGDLYLQQGQHKVALNYYQQAYQSFTDAKNLQGRVENSAGFPDNEYNASLMLGKIGRASLELGDLSGAASAFSRMYAVKPDPAKLAGLSTSGVTSGVKPSAGGILSGGRPSLGGVFGGGGKPKVPALPTSLDSALSKTRGFVEFYRQTIIYSVREVGTGRIDYINNNLPSAQKHFTEALSAASLPLVNGLSQTRRVRAAARTALGDILLQQNKPKDAAKFYQEALSGAKADQRLDLAWPAQRGLARSQWLLAMQEKDAKKGLAGRDTAIAGYREAIGTIEAIRAGSLRADEARTTFLENIESVYEEAAHLCAEAALIAAGLPVGGTLTGASVNYAVEGFKFSEQGRARSLLDMLGETGVNITADVPADLVQRKQDNLARQQEIAGQLTGLALNEGDNAVDTKRLDDELEQLTVEYDAIENQIRAASPRYAALTAPQPLTLADVQQKVLDDKTALLEYNLGANASYLWVVTGNSVALHKLPAREQVNKLAQELRAAILPPAQQRRLVGIDVATDTRGIGLLAGAAPSPVANFTTASNALYQAVFAPAATNVGDKRLLIVADGALNYIPFETLVSSVNGTDYASLPYLITTNEVAYTPSASVIGFFRQQSATPATGKNVLIVADPVFYGADPRARGAAATTAQASSDARGLGLVSALSDVSGEDVTTPATGAGLPLARLLGTRAEAQQITALTRQAGGVADTLLDLDASETNLMTRDLKKYRVLHIATHGLLNAARPQFTGLALSLVGNKTGDGFLRTDEVFNLSLGRPLVMLSACQTGLGREKRGEGVLGLTRAFMYAGAPTVGVSLWSVADNSTALLMTEFYKKYLAAPNTSPTTALRAAQRAMIAGKKYSAPFYWSPFVLNGEWR